MDLTIGYVTARREPELSWFFDSLLPQLRSGERPTIIIVDILAETRDMASVDTSGFDVKHVPCKPNVWQGGHRLTPRDWWAVSNYRNTAACLCQTKWLAVIDDRCVLAPTYLAAARRAMEGGYACAGRYEKRRGMRVQGGVIVEPGQITGVDPRFKNQNRPTRIAGGAFFGANSVQPLEFVLRVNGWDESCDSLGMEDSIYGAMLERNGFPIRYDPDLSMIEDRSEWANETMTIRADKGLSPHDKSHALLKRTAGKLQATHDTDLKAIRSTLAAGGAFPIPSGPTCDWYDGQPLSEFGSQRHVEGWCCRQKAIELYDRIQELSAAFACPLKCVELGVFEGKSLFLQAQSLRDSPHGGHITGIDPYTVEAVSEGFDLNHAHELAHVRWWSGLDLRKHELRCREQIAARQLLPWCSLLSVMPDAVAHEFDRLHWLHLDDCHSPSATLRNAQMWIPKLLPGGLLCVDDVHWDTMQPARQWIADHMDFVSDAAGEGMQWEFYRARRA